MPTAGKKRKKAQANKTRKTDLIVTVRLIGAPPEGQKAPQVVAERRFTNRERLPETMERGDVLRFTSPTLPVQLTVGGRTYDVREERFTLSCIEEVTDRSAFDMLCTGLTDLGFAEEESSPADEADED